MQNPLCVNATASGAPHSEGRVRPMQKCAERACRCASWMQRAESLPALRSKRDRYHAPLPSASLSMCVDLEVSERDGHSDLSRGDSGGSDVEFGGDGEERVDVRQTVLHVRREHGHITAGLNLGETAHNGVRVHLDAEKKKKGESESEQRTATKLESCANFVCFCLPDSQSRTAGSEKA